MVINLRSLLKRKNKKSEAISREDSELIKESGDQFKKLIDKGIELPVVLL